MIFVEFSPENRIWHFMQIVCNGDALHEMSNHFLFRGGVIFDPLTFITFWANSACDKVVIVYPGNRI